MRALMNVRTIVGVVAGVLAGFVLAVSPPSWANFDDVKPLPSPSTSGNVLTSDGTNWTSTAPSGSLAEMTAGQIVYATAATTATSEASGFGWTATTNLFSLIGVTPASVGSGASGTVGNALLTATSGNGGAITTATGTPTAGAAAPNTITLGLGGAASGASTTNTGGKGGGLTVVTGAGGAATNAGTNNGGAGGDFLLTLGAGGAGASAAGAAGRFGVNDTTPDGIVGISAGTLPDLIEALNLTATLPTTTSAENTGALISIAGAGASSFIQNASAITLAAGYTGSSSTRGLYVQNLSVGTNAAGTSLGGNAAVIGVANSATATGHNVGGSFDARNSSVLNLALLGRSVVTANGAANVGVLGKGINAGSTPVQVGGWFVLSDVAPTFEDVALAADNAALAAPIALFKDNGATVVSIEDGGALVLTQAANEGTCALVSGTPSTCTATVRASSICVCAPQGATAAIAAGGCAWSLSGTTLTLTGPDTVTTVVSYHCF